MKALIIGLALVSSISAFAGNGVESCKALLGNYKCDYQGQLIDLSVAKNAAANSIKISIAGEGQDFILDGAPHKSSVDDSQNVAECKAGKEIVIDNLFKGELKGSFSVLKTPAGIEYTMIQGKNSVVLKCRK